ncbi:MAG: CPBP family intramembrane metalloprotease [Simkania negevensis]|nr:CPBP family intramembrane metalloprotease [Simkania negevensis]
MVKEFSYWIFFQQPFVSLAFFSLIMAFTSLWLYKRVWLWLSFLSISFFFAIMSKLIDSYGLTALAFLFLVHLILTKPMKKRWRLFYISATTFLSLALFLHLLPWFHNWKMAEKISISSHGVPYTLFLNYDKPFIGFFPLALSIPLTRNLQQFKTTFIKIFALSLLGLLLLLLLTFSFHLVHIDLKFPRISGVWLIANLFFVTIAEEAFFRGFLQREIEKFFPSSYGTPLSIFLVSLFFALLHLGFVFDFSFAFLAFVASLIYGTIYWLTRSIEGAIFAHFLFNLTHFFFFTYPLLDKQLPH